MDVYDLIKVTDDAVKEAETLDLLMNEFFLLVEVRKARQRSKEDADVRVRLRVQLLTHTNTRLCQSQTHICNTNVNTSFQRQIQPLRKKISFFKKIY